MILEPLQRYLKQCGVNCIFASDFEGRRKRIVCASGERVYLSADGEIAVEKGRDNAVYNLILEWIDDNRELVDDAARAQGEEDLESNEQEIRLQVDVYLPDAEPESEIIQLERIRGSVGAFLKKFGFTPDPSAKSVLRQSSWLWQEWFRSTGKREATEIYDGMKESLRREFIDKAGAEAFEKRATAAAKLLESLSPYSRAFVRLGDVIVAKAVVDDKPEIVIETVSPEISRVLEQRPELLRDPEAFIRFVGPGVPSREELIGDASHDQPAIEEVKPGEIPKIPKPK